MSCRAASSSVSEKWTTRADAEPDDDALLAHAPTAYNVRDRAHMGAIGNGGNGCFYQHRPSTQTRAETPAIAYDPAEGAGEEVRHAEALATAPAVLSDDEKVQSCEIADGQFDLEGRRIEQR